MTCRSVPAYTTPNGRLVVLCPNCDRYHWPSTRAGFGLRVPCCAKDRDRWPRYRLDDAGPAPPDLLRDLVLRRSVYF